MEHLFKPLLLFHNTENEKTLHKYQIVIEMMLELAEQVSWEMPTPNRPYKIQTGIMQIELWRKIPNELALTISAGKEF